MKEWEHLLESDGHTETLRRRALKTQDDNDWANYEHALIRQGEVSRALDRMVKRASLDRMDLVRRVLEQVQAQPNYALLLTTRHVQQAAPSAVRTRAPSDVGPMEVESTYLIVSVTGSSLRVRRRIGQPGLVSGTRWGPPTTINPKDVQNGRLNIAGMRPEDMPPE